MEIKKIAFMTMTNIFLEVVILVFLAVFNLNGVVKAQITPPINDALIPPDRVRAIQAGEFNTPRIFPDRAPYGAGFYDTSEYMLGKISIAVILPQCDGGVDTCSESWDAVREADVYNRIQTGMTWLANQEPNANISFVWHLYSGRTDARAKTSYEPITRSTYEDSNGFALWMPEMMAKFGYQNGDYFNQTRAFVNDMIAQDSSDWGYIFFVADSLNDGDGAFGGAYQRTAGGYYGGPFAFGTYDNGGYSISGMDFIAAHESAHVFYATDEYNNTLEQSGYLGAYDDDGSNCFMKQLAWCMSTGSREQLGWRDSDGDNILDILDTEPLVSLPSISKSATNDPAYSGVAQVNPLLNQNPQFTNAQSAKHNISLNTVAEVQYQVDGGAWQTAKAGDGAFSAGAEDFIFAFSNLAPGSHAVAVKTKNNLGAWTTPTNYAQDNLFVLSPHLLTSAELGKYSLKLFDSSGVRKKQFYPYGKKYSKGVKLTTGDLDGDREDEIITATQKGVVQQIKIFNSQGKAVLKKAFYPYGKKSVYKNCETNLATGDINGDGKDEIAVSLDCFRQIKIFNKNGKKIYSFYPFSKAAGSNFVMADFDGQTGDEIAVVQATSAKPLVKIFRLENGKFKLKKQFYAYQKNKNIKMNLAAGDINADGKAELIVSPAHEFSRPIRVFNQNGRQLKKTNLYPFGRNFTNGINVAAFDANQDGYSEILVSKELGENNQVKIYSWKQKKAKLLKSFRPYPKKYFWGVNLAGGYF